MGDAGDDNVVDERMWNEEDERDTKNADQKKEQGGTVQDDGKQELEMGAAEDEEDGPGGEEDGRDNKPEKREDGKPAEEEDGDDEPQVNEGAQQEDNDLMSAQPEELQLPDDMQLDGDDMDGDEAEEGGDQEEDGAEGAEEDAPDMGQREATKDPAGGGEDDKGGEEVGGDDPSAEAGADEPKDDDTGGDGGGEDEAGEQGAEDEEAEGAEEEEEGGKDARGQPDGAGPDEEAQTFGGGGAGAEGDPAADEAPESGGADASEKRLPRPTRAGCPEASQGQDRGDDDTAAEETPSPEEAGAEGSGERAAGEEGGQGASEGGSKGAVAPGSGPEPPAGGAPPRRPDPNPFRSLGDAMRQFRDRVKVVGDEQEGADRPEEGGDGGGGDEAPGQEFQFVREEEEGGGTQEGVGQQALAPATEEQAVALDTLPDKEEAGGDAAEEMDTGPDGQGEEGPDNADGVAGSASTKTWKAGKKAGIDDVDHNNDGGDEGGEAMEDDAGEEGGDPEGGEDEKGGAEQDSFVQLARDLGVGLDEQDNEPEEPERLTEEAAACLREEARVAVVEAATAEEDAEQAEARSSRARALWPLMEALTAQLAQELAEQLRLILEPTQASKLQGDFRTGKRINMKKVIPYIASHFRKDKIWMRRTKPDKRRYQVVLAVDDSRSMAENGCGHFALEALTLLSRAMSRLEVGELGVVGFGETGRVRALHDLEQPFSDQAAMDLLGQMTFRQDNTIADRPMAELLSFLEGMLEEGRARAAGGHERLQQLVLVLADGRFHEKEPLRRAVRDMCDRSGLLVVFLALDNPKSSLLDMQTVSFAGGKPVLSKYLDTFPFPYYILLRDTAALPRTLADLLRQWFELTSNG